MQRSLIKCSHCSFLYYGDKGLVKCPSCGAKTNTVESPFAGESIVVKTMDGMRKIVDDTVTFEQAEATCNAMLYNNLNSVIVDETLRNRVIFMLIAYVWTLVKQEPQLWAHRNLLLNGMVEILSLKIEGPKNDK